eukprot:SAG22_NODE_17922_length_296_cov_0.791878_1_plen_49_part_10
MEVAFLIVPPKIVATLLLLNLARLDFGIVGGGAAPSLDVRLAGVNELST